LPSLFGLAPGGVFHAFFVTKKTGALLPHLFTLALIRRFIFCGTIPGVSPARCYLAPCSLEPGLSSPAYFITQKRLINCLAVSVICKKLA